MGEAKDPSYAGAANPIVTEVESDKDHLQQRVLYLHS